MRDYFLTTPRLGFSVWTADDGALADSLWGDPAVTRFICAAGSFSSEEVAARLALEIRQYEQFHIQYFPVFLLDGGELLGCCGLRPYHGGVSVCELGVHLRPQFWRRGMALEAAWAAMRYAFTTLGVVELKAGHHPQNLGSRALLSRLGFICEGTEFYPPTELDHPAYKMTRSDYDALN